jgi:hypothetical protein
METYGHILVIVTPLFLFLVLFENGMVGTKAKKQLKP